MKHLDTFKQKILDKELVNYSSKSSSLQKMRELIEEGANVNYCDINGDTPLMKSSLSLFYSGIKLLIESGADVNIQNRNGETAFLIIVDLPSYIVVKNLNNIKKIIDLFINNNANLNIKNKKGYDIFDYLKNYKFMPNDKNVLNDYIKNNFPKKYEEYSIIKNSEKYNL